MPKLSFQYVAADGAPESLADFLERRFRYHTREEWCSLAHDGHVTVDGSAVPPTFILSTGNRIVYHRPPGPEPDVDRRYTVLYEDEHLLAVAKSGNIPTSPSGKYWHNCLVHILQEERGLSRLHAVHRLDRETSGVNLLAKTREAARALGKDFQQGRIEKTYLAILRGRLPVRGVYLSAPLQSDPESSVRIRQAVHPVGRDARSRFTLLARLSGASLVRIETLTGRTHQIRAHAQFLGYPVHGDKLYGRSDDEFIEWIGENRPTRHPRQLLHAWKLRITHPVEGVGLEFCASEVGLVERFVMGV